MKCSKPLFPLGQIVVTPGAINALTRANQKPQDFLVRHVNGNWGELSKEDQAENDYSLQHGFRLLSSYRTATGEQLWLVTEADRTITLLLPEEY